VYTWDAIVQHGNVEMLSVTMVARDLSSRASGTRYITS
jgi:hypothetical protein